MYWNVNGNNRFSFAGDGVLLGSVDLYEAEDPDFADEIDLPVELRELFSAAGHEDADLLATGLALIATFTEVEMRHEDVARVDVNPLRGC